MGGLVHIQIIPTDPSSTRQTSRIYKSKTETMATHGKEVVTFVSTGIKNTLVFFFL